MAVTEKATGSATMGTTEWSLINNSSTIATDTTAAVFQLFLDLSALAKGDQFQIRVYEKTRTGDTQRAVFTVLVANAQTDPIFVTPALMLKNGWDMTIKKIAGTDRAIPWSIRQV